MTQTQVLKRIRRSHWRSLEGHLKHAYQAGVEEGRARARGAGRRGRTFRGDATVEGLTRLIERHFGLDRYGFEVRVVHAASGRRVPAGDRIRRYRIED